MIMDDTTYNEESSSGNNSFERRLRLANAAVGIALMGAKLSQGKPNEDSTGEKSSGQSSARGRSKTRHK